MNRKSKIIILILLDLGLVGLLAWGVKANLFHDFDLQVSTLVQGLNPPIWDLIMKGVSWIGYPPQTQWVTIIILGIMAVALGVKRAAIAQAMSMGSYLTGNWFKHLLDRSRPENFGIIPWQEGLEGGTRSFPAGHVGIFTALGLIAAVFIRRKYTGRGGKLAARLVVLFVILLGISRVYLGEHWATDVIAGYLVGLSWVGVFMLIFPHYGQKNSQQPKI